MSVLLQRVRAVDRRHPLWWDVAAALLVAAISANTTPNLDPLGLALLLTIHGALIFRRRSPLPALLTAFSGVLLAGVLTLLADSTLPWMFLAVWMLLFNLGLRERGTPVGLVCAVIGLMAGAALTAPANEGILQVDERIGSSLAVLGMCAASFLLGTQIRSSREQLTTQRAEVARSAVIAERSRIAQEMHDIIGHNLSVITSLANGGAVVARTSPQEAAQAFDLIGTVSRSSVRDVRRILTVLRHDYSADGVSLSPQPGLEDLAALIESVRAAGLVVQLERLGDLRRLSAGRELAAYRIVQESLTNALRHAGTHAQVNVKVAREPHGLLVSVKDNGPTALEARRQPVAEPGQGIRGMRERAEAYGGSLEAGATRTGWMVQARIPADQSEDGE